MGLTKAFIIKRRWYNIALKNACGACERALKICLAHKPWAQIPNFSGSRVVNFPTLSSLSEVITNACIVNRAGKVKGHISLPFPNGRHGPGEVGQREVLN